MTRPTGWPWIDASDVAFYRNAMNDEGVEPDTAAYERMAATGASFFEAKCGRSDVKPRRFLVADVTVFIDGRGDDRLLVPDGPIVSVSSVQVCGQTLSLGTLDELAAGSKACSFDGSELIARAPFPRGTRNVKFVGRTGYAREEIPEDLRDAAAYVGAALYGDRGEAIGVNTKSHGDGTSTTRSRSWPPFVADALQLYLEKFTS